jgi:predicted RNase H-like nuclease (RuvC/YqgF family)
MKAIVIKIEKALPSKHKQLARELAKYLASRADPQPVQTLDKGELHRIEREFKERIANMEKKHMEKLATKESTLATTQRQLSALATQLSELQKTNEEQVGEIRQLRTGRECQECQKSRRTLEQKLERRIRAVAEEANRNKREYCEKCQDILDKEIESLSHYRELFDSVRQIYDRLNVTIFTGREARQFHSIASLAKFLVTIQDDATLCEWADDDEDMHWCVMKDGRMFGIHFSPDEIAYITRTRQIDKHLMRKLRHNSELMGRPA